MRDQTSNTTLAGSIEIVTFHNPESGYCVLKIKVAQLKDLVAVVGVVGAAVSQGELIEAAGVWWNDPKFGRQFKASSIRLLPPTSLRGIEKYLASGQVRNIGPKLAKALVAHFGAEVLTIIEHQDERLLEVEGIGEQRRDAIMEAWADQKQVRELSVFLQSFGLGPGRAMRVFKALGDDALSIIRQNPYALIQQVKGLGFKTVDQMAIEMGIGPDSLQRAVAGLIHTMDEAASDGHCAMLETDLLAVGAERLEQPEARLKQALEEALREKNLISRASESGEVLCYLPALFFAEVMLAKDVQRLMSHQKPWANLNVDDAIELVQSSSHIEYSESQILALRKTIVSQVCVITGGPGVGKTTIMQGLLRMSLQCGKKVMLAAPTGRAAKRLSEAAGHAAKTIHRLLEFDPVTRGFKHHKQHPLQCDVLIVDESSMIDVRLMQKLVSAIPDGCRLWLVGDIDQLPSVGPGAVLADMIASDIVPVLRLTEVYRQAKHSKIIRNAHRIHEGEMPYLGEQDKTKKSDFYFIASDGPEDAYNKLIEVVTRRMPQRFDLDPVKDIQVLTPMNRSALGAKTLNPALQSLLNLNANGPHIERFGQRFCVGDKVLQLRNNYDKDVFNGDLGFVIDVDLEEVTMLLDFEGRKVEYKADSLDELTLAYAMTVHKSQGGEYPAVVIPVVMQHFTMLERNLLYTGVTRGKRLVVLIGEKRALAIAVRNQRAGQRLTSLAERIQEESLDEMDTAQQQKQILGMD